jgi:hypothetical protein
MIRPNPHTVKCPKCQAEAVIHPKSDCLSLMDMIRLCKKCDVYMKRTDDPSLLSKIEMALRGR